MRLRAVAPRPAWLAMLLMVVPLIAQPAEPAPRLATLDQAQAAPAGWRSKAAPTSGWTSVTLPDDWSNRWPHHDGVVWYRLRWHQASDAQPMALLVNQVTLAGAVYINGSLIHRDPHLTEPLSRSWIKPQYFVIAQPLLRAGTNTVLIRVSGLADYQPGLGVVKVGDPRAVYAAYHRGVLVRYRIRLYDLAIYLAMGIVFLVLWSFRRKDTLYGWFSVSTLLTAAWDWNNVAPSAWPFTSTDAFQAWNMVFYLAAAVTLAVFLLRFCERRWRRIEAVLWFYVLVTAEFALFASHLLGVYRFKLAIPAIALYYLVPLVFIVYAARARVPDRVALAVCLLIPLLMTVHDVLRFFEIIHDAAYIASFTAPLTLIGMSIVLAYRYSAAMRRVEGFNVELTQQVQRATAQLSTTLGEQHALALAHTRAQERLQLVRDLHDGFGGSLLGTIAALEQAPKSPQTTSVIARLKELRDDLRLVIRATTHKPDADLADLLVPLHHRWSQRLEAAGIDSRWQLRNLGGVRLAASHNLDLLRALQEALTNVLKHSRARHVDITLERAGKRLQLTVADDGAGFDPSAATGTGAGVASLRARAHRLGAQLRVESAPNRGATVNLDLPLSPAKL